METILGVNGIQEQKELEKLMEDGIQKYVATYLIIPTKLNFRLIQIQNGAMILQHKHVEWDVLQ